MATLLKILLVTAFIAAVIGSQTACQSVAGRHYGAGPANPGSGLRGRHHPGTSVRSEKKARHKNPLAGWPKLPQITKRRPLRIVVTGDSLPEALVGQVAALAGSRGPVTVAPYYATTFPSTGLCRPDFFSWYAQAKKETLEYHPDLVVMLIGGNDDQNEQPQNIQLDTPAWERAYRGRAWTVMREFIKYGARRVYWLSLPPPGHGFANATKGFHLIDVAVQEAAKHVKGVRYVNVIPAVTNHGRYTDYKVINGVRTLIREPDGVHLNLAGTQLIANYIVPKIKREFKFGWSAVRARTKGKRHVGRARQ